MQLSAESRSDPASHPGWRARVQKALRSTRLLYLGEVGLLAGVYFIAAKLSLLLAIPPGYATPVWPPSGIALAAILLFGKRVWPGIWLGAAFVNYTINSSALAAVIIGSGNTLEALAGAAMIRYFIGVPWRFGRGEDVATFVAAAVLSATIAAIVGLVPLAYTHALSVPELFWNWLTWWLGDAVGILIVTPLILSWCVRGTVSWTPPRQLEAACLSVLFLFTAGAIFLRTDGVHFDPLALKFLVLPFIIWVAFRFGQREVTAATLAVCVLSVWDTFSGGRAPGATAMNQTLLILLAFNSTVAILGLTLTTVVGERRRVTEALQKGRDELESRVRERTLELERANRALQLDIASRTRTEKLLLESEERFRQMVTSVVDYAIFMLDTEGRVVSWNAGAERIKGYRAQEIIGQHFSRFYTRADVDDGKPWRELEVASVEGRLDDEGWRLRKDGSTYWAGVVITAVRDAAGKLIGFSEVTRDLTAHRRFEEALRHKNVELEQLFESAPDATMLVDPAGLIRRVNAQAQTMFGYGRDELTGSPIEVLLPQRFHERHVRHRDQYLGNPHRRPMGAGLELFGRRRDGSEFPVDVMLSPVDTDQGRLVLGVVRDLTDRVRTEEALRRGEARFGALVNSVVDYAIIMLDADGCITSWNTGAERIIGYTAGEIIGQHFSRFYYREDVERGKPQHELELAASTGRCEDEGWRIRKDGSRYWANVVVTAVRDRTGELIGFSKVTRDLSERKRLEVELTDAKIAAEQSSRMKTEFLAKMSHELRTPLNSLLILARLLADNASNNLTAKQIQYAQTIHAAGTDLLDLINDLLDLAKIESGTVTLVIDAERFADLRDYVKHSFEQIAHDKRLEFDITIDERLPPAIRTDGRRLHQILRNLLANAFKFTHRGRVSLLIAPAKSGWTPGHTRLDAADAVIAFSVTDTGIGIPHDKKETVFEAFQQLDEGTSRQYGGAGLGLAICRELTRLLGGELRIRSEPGQGSTFVLFLPLPDRAESHPERSSGSTRDMRGGAAMAAAASGNPATHADPMGRHGKGSDRER
ncbi:MAG: PAS domain S-box protein [Betaproteobacteria bacterium]|nr:PAS domain S-box protein [Betaproteobacteria bacterium]